MHTCPKIAEYVQNKLRDFKSNHLKHIEGTELLYVSSLLKRGIISKQGVILVDYECFAFDSLPEAFCFVRFLLEGELPLGSKIVFHSSSSIEIQRLGVNHLNFCRASLSDEIKKINGNYSGELHIAPLVSLIINDEELRTLKAIVTQNYIDFKSLPEQIRY